VLETLEVGRQGPRRWPDGSAAPVWSPEALFKLFPNLGEMPDRPGGRTSGGEQQMLTVARTLMGNPKADWVYPTEPDASANGRSITWAAGKVLGGSIEGNTALVVFEADLNGRRQRGTATVQLTSKAWKVRDHGDWAPVK